MLYGYGYTRFYPWKKFPNHTIINNPTVTKSRILPQLLVKSMLIPLQISTLRTGTTHLWLSGSRIALDSRNWRSSLEVSIRFRPRRTRANERSVQLDTWWLTWERPWIQSIWTNYCFSDNLTNSKGRLPKNFELYCVLLNGVIKS